MKVIDLISNATGSRTGPIIPIWENRLINGSIPIHIFGENIAATIEIQGTIATQSELNSGASEATFTTIEDGTFYVKTATALFAPFTHIKANISSYTSGTVSVRVLI